MKNISGQYQDLLEGRMTQSQFLRNARMMFPSFVTNHNSFEDSVTILRQKGMLTEGDAVKGVPNKAPEYDYPTQDAKYKKVEQSPEVDEQDGIYPATTLTDIPKEKASKRVVSKTRPDGLEDIKDKDTKNEMKKVRIVKESWDDEPYYDDMPPRRKNKDWDTDDDVEDRYDDFEDEEDNLDENEKSFKDILKHTLETDDDTKMKAYLNAKGKEAIAKIKAELPRIQAKGREKLARLMKIELDEMKTGQRPPDTISLLSILKRIEAQTKAKFFAISNADELKDVFDYILDRVNPTLSSSTTQLRTALNQAVQSNLDDKKAKLSKTPTTSSKVPTNTSKTPPSLEERLKEAKSREEKEDTKEESVNKEKDGTWTLKYSAINHDTKKRENLTKKGFKSEQAAKNFMNMFNENKSNKTPLSLGERLKPIIAKLVQEVKAEKK